MDIQTRALSQVFMTRPLICNMKIILLNLNNIYHTMLTRKDLAGMESLEELESFVDTKLLRLIDDGDNGFKSKKSYNSSSAILKLPK